MEIDTKRITRLEVIDVTDETKRKFVKWDCKIKPSVQDDGRTLKIFVEYDKEENK